MSLPDELSHLELQPHPEGGFFRETHRSALLTTIDFVLLAGQYSGWHVVHGSEEVWNHCKGGRIALHLLDADGYRVIELGKGRWSAVVPAGTWQATETLDDAWTLVGCTVAPPFTFGRFAMATAQDLRAFPHAPAQISRLLR